MGGGGKGGTSTSTISIPPEVLARYNSVNARAEEVAKQPFQSYGGEFVAPLTQTQQQGIQQTQDYSQAAQPYYQTAAGMTGAAAQAVQPYYGAATGITGAALAGAQPNYQQAFGMTTGAANAAQPLYGAAELQTLRAGQPLSPQQIQQYQNPFVQSVVDPTLQALRQQQGIDLTRQQAQQIQSGAYGGDRAGLSRAMLQGQQGLAQAQAISPLYQSAYQNALQAAQQQQQVGLTGAQQLGSLAGQQLQGQLGAGQQLGALTGQQYTNALAGAQQLAGIGGQQLQGQLSSAQQLAGIGTGAQQAGLQGAQAVIGAGTLGQQTKQAQDTAQYQQFLQQRGYDFQTAQFLANIAEGTGALSGSTTTSTQPTSFFSDERLKHDIKKIGKTNDGQPIYSFKYNGDDRTQIGLLAQEVEKKHPEAVGLSGGYKTVDYAKATAGSRTARAMGGLVPESMGGAVFEPGNFARGGYVGGGLVNDPNDIQAILAAQKQSMGPFGQSGLYGGSSQQDPHGAVSGYVPKATLPVPKLVTSSFQPKAQQSELQTAMQNINAAGKAAETLSGGWDAGRRGLLGAPATDKTAASSGLLGAGGKYDIGKGWLGDDVTKSAYGGGIMPRHHFANGGPEDSMQDDFTTPGLVKEDKVEGKENRANVPASGFPTDVLSSGTSAKELAVAKNPSTSGGQSGMSSLAQGLGAANNALKAGKSISTMIGGGADAIGGGGTFAAGMGPFMSEAGVGAAGAGAAEGAGILGGLGSALGTIGEGMMAILPFFGLSDARLKDNIKQVGKTFDGQNIYSYDMGDGRTQMGLLAQEVLHHKPEAVGEKQGYLTVDYRKATEDSAPHRSAGGLVPRQGYQEGGPLESNVVPVPDFNKAVSRTFEFEGGLNPADTNGTPSLYGINQAAHPEFFKNPSKEAAANIYKTQYWDAIGADKLDPRLAHVAYDTAVISGPGKAQEFIKQSGGDPEKLLQLRRQFQDNLIAQDPGKYGKYEKAWNNRLSTLAGDISASAPNQPQAGPQPQAAGVKPWYDKMAPTDYQGKERTMGEFLTSKDFVIPLLSGLGTMASSPSRYLGSAILQGLGGAAQAYQGVQKQQADIGQTRATTTSTLSNIPPQNLVGQYDSKGNLIWNVRKPTAPGQLGLAGGALGGGATGAAGAGTPSALTPLPQVTGTAAAPKAPELNPLSVNTDQGRYNWEVNPTQMTDQYFSKNQLGDDPYTINALIPQKGLSKQAETDEKISSATKAAATNTTEARMKIGQLTDELSRLATSPSKSTGVGPGQAERAAAVNLYNYLAGLSGLPGFQFSGAEKDATSAQIINKIQQDFGSSQAQNRGFHAGYIANALSEAFPTGSMTPEAARKMSAALYVGNQMAADFARYHDNYIQKYGTSLGAPENFKREMGSQYDQDKKIIETALQKPGLVEYLRAHPDKAAEFDNYWKRPGLARMFIGG